MSFYSDLLRSVNGRLGYNAEDPDRVDNNVDYKLSFAAKPKKTIDLSLEKKVERKDAEDGTATLIEKTNSKLKINHGDCTTTWGFANDKWTFNAKGKAVDQDGWRVDLSSSAEVKQAKQEWKVSSALDIKGSDLGGAKLGLNTLVDYNNKSEINVEPKINLEVNDEFNVGVSAKWDTKAFKEIWPQVVYRPTECKDSQYWFRADITRKLAMAGCDQRLKDGINHSFELVYGYGGLKGIQGHPVALRGGVEYELSDQTTVGVSANWDESYQVSQDVEHQIDRHWTVTASQSFDASNVGSKVSPYHIGFAASYKL